MALPPEYEEYLKRNLNAIERFTAVFSGLDERIDYTNILLTKLIELQGGAPTEPTLLVTALNSLITTLKQLAIPVVPNRSSFLTGQRTVTTAGTAEQLSTSVYHIPNGFQVTIIAWPTNTGYIYIGNSKSSAEGAMSFNGLSAGLAVSLKITDISLVWVTSTVDGEGVSWIVEQ